VLINIAEGRTSILPNWRMSRLAPLTPETLHDWIDGRATRALLPPSLCEKLAALPAPRRCTPCSPEAGRSFPTSLAQLTGHGGTAQR
jgi:hypothetical protein